MASGKEILKSIDGELRDVRHAVSAQTKVLAKSSRYLADVRHEQADAYRSLAHFRLDQIQEKEVAQGLDSSERHAKSLLERHAENLEKAGAEVAAGEARIAELEEQREHQAETTDQALLALEEALEGTRARLENEPAYSQQASAVEQAHEVATQAAQKAELAENDRLEKGAPYESDPLFMYLWKRQYGTDAYSAFPLIRFMDGWVARLCDYRDARRNYRILTEIPERMQEHADRVALELEAEENKLVEIEEAAFMADGHGPTRDHAAAEEDKLADIDGEIAKAEETHLAASARHAALASGNDPTFREALESVLSGLRTTDLEALRKEALLTPLPDDDELVEKLLQLEDEEGFLQERVAQESRTVETSEKVLGDLEWVRQRFKSNAFDGPYSFFKDEHFVEPLVTQLTRGAISRDTLWTSISRRHRSRARRQRVPASLPWSLGRAGRSLGRSIARAGRSSGRRSWSGSFGRSSRGFGGGSFRTAGSFGRSGGFSTGGKF